LKTSWSSGQEEIKARRFAAKRPPRGLQKRPMVANSWLAGQPSLFEGL
jgi:hypothetical protein